MTSTRTSTRLRLPLTALTGLAAAVALTACGSSNDAATGGDPAPATTAPVSTAPASTGSDAETTPPAATATATGKGTPVTVTETEFSIALGTQTFKAGTYTFTVKNAGSIVHALNIDGPGVEDASTGSIEAGATGTVTVTLQSGMYDIYCPVGDHKMEGMDQMVMVA